MKIDPIELGFNVATIIVLLGSVLTTLTSNFVWCVAAAVLVIITFVITAWTASKR